ncbi:16S rRNA (cytidine(1402)-2'-O)-methyltransferase [Aquicella lusitana]|uniref:Ribosomal RNA small subunit methyltransferase I n=1 Tax=Aquicella lusitana TaxID=254246 RepID=A0A370GQK1_9COXI|nr:16S rRNA (cytidine(1402)-2'-O)-methyltransferase [Aquicella lusitana]RDI44764.1 16S rRNA (cytidine1402-2'-O)-methyltransferase [Aquicella lusitana]VVC72961.1 Ribosomal RNA small subunit methyltransferase I [Aquicella lusitana]
MHSNKIGTLYVVATPIGNLQDISLRAIEVLKKVDRVAAEDTRHAMQLLNHFSINKPTLSLHEFNERERVGVLLAYLQQQGESVALVSDAGTPLISDPGFLVVREAKAVGIPVVPVPGPCAAITALSVSGLATDRFIFEGFLPAKEEARRQRLTLLRHEKRTLIFYEAPHRLLDTLQSMSTVFGSQRKAVVARELTKVHESVLAMDLAALIAWFTSHPDQQRGEIVILVTGAEEEKQHAKEVIPKEALAILLEELPLKQAVALASKITGERKNVLYELALSMKGNA